MLYNSIKIIHILSATLLMTTMANCIVCWWIKGRSALSSIGVKTAFLITPFAIIQLLSGFTMLSLHREYLMQWWVKMSIICFVTALGGWFLFLYCLHAKKKRPRFEKVSLLLCVVSLLGMIFFMANKV